MAKIITCPFCLSDDIERIKRSRLIRTFVPWLRVKRYRCLKCGKNSYHKTARA